MSPVDWILLGVLMAGLLISGWIVRTYMQSVADFVVLNRRMRMYLGLSTWSVEGIGLVSIAYLTEQGFQSGLGYVWMTLLSMALYVPVFGILGFGIRRFRATRVQTIPQYHEMRFSKGVRIMSGISLAVGGILNMAIFPAVSSRFLVLFMGLPPEIYLFGTTLSVEKMTMILLVVVSAFMAMIGGMVTMVVTDYIQYVLLTVSMFVLTVLAVVAANPSQVNVVLTEKMGDAAFNPFLQSAGGEGYGITWVMFFLLSGVIAPLCFPPSTVKLASTDSPETTRRMALLGSILNMGRNVMLLIWGACALTFVTQHPDIVQTFGSIEPRYATASFLHSISPVGILGICAFGMICAYISTDNGYYLSWSAIIVNDIITPMRGKPLSTKTHFLLLRCTIVCIATFLLIWGIVYPLPESILSYIYLTGTIFTSAGIITFFGLYWRRASSAGAYWTAFVCLAVPLADIFGKWWLTSNFGDRIKYPLKSHESGLLSILLAIIGFVVIGLISDAGEVRWKDYGAVLKSDQARRPGGDSTRADL
ncbi:MAG: hypothetical protein O3C60_13295 [Planctomycetota bacterium]|nr:hypothetical protein [Planctomycetota bacterium]